MKRGMLSMVFSEGAERVTPKVKGLVDSIAPVEFMVF